MKPVKLLRYRTRYAFNSQRHKCGLVPGRVYEVPDDADHVRRCGCGQVVAVLIGNTWRCEHDLKPA